MRLVVAISGYSGAGKTTLIEALLPRLCARGLRVGVVKHDAHKLALEPEGKDTARFFAAGAAAVCGHDPTQHFVRVRDDAEGTLSDALAALPGDLDLVLVEGHKDLSLPKLVVEHPEPRPPVDVPGVLARLPWGKGRTERAEERLVAWIERAWRRRPVAVGLFFGTGSRRPAGRRADSAGRALRRLARQLGEAGNRVVLVGDGRPPESLDPALPRLPGVPGLSLPLAGLLSLLRHDPELAWLCAACEQPGLGSRHARWLGEQRRPGIWAILPRLPGAEGVAPFGAIYEPPLLAYLERAVGRGARALHQALRGAPTASPEPPAELVAGWRGPPGRS